MFSLSWLVDFVIHTKGEDPQGSTSLACSVYSWEGWTHGHHVSTRGHPATWCQPGVKAPAPTLSFTQHCSGHFSHQVLVRCFISDLLCASLTISLGLFFFPGVWSYTLCAVSPTEGRWQLDPCSSVASAVCDQQKPADRAEPPYFLLYLLLLPSPSPTTSVCTCSHTPLICRQNMPQTRFHLEKDNGCSVFFPRRIGTLGKGMLRRIVLKPCVHSKHIVSTLFSKDPLFPLYTRSKTVSFPH